MPTAGAVLRELHRLQQTARDLRDEIARVPRQIELQQARVARAEATYRETQEALKRLRVDIHQKETEMKAKLQSADKHQVQMNQASSKKEYDALRAEIGVEIHQSKQLEDEILTIMLEADQRAGQLPEAEREMKRAKDEIAGVIREIEARRDDLSKRLLDVEKELKEVEQGLPADVKPQYDRMVGYRGQDALATTHGRTCTACYTEITAQQYNELRLGQFAICKNCGRMLYTPEST